MLLDKSKKQILTRSPFLKEKGSNLEEKYCPGLRHHSLLLRPQRNSAEEAVPSLPIRAAALIFYEEITCSSGVTSHYKR